MSELLQPVIEAYIPQAVLLCLEEPEDLRFFDTDNLPTIAGEAEIEALSGVIFAKKEQGGHQKPPPKIRGSIYKRPPPVSEKQKGKPKPTN
jgi:hypothetical protein